MPKPGSEAAHDEKVAELLGDAAERVAASPVAYPSLDRPDLIDAALAAGKVCRTTSATVRLLVYRDADLVKAVVTELAHGGYRRRYKLHTADSVAALVEEITTAYA